MRRSLLPLAFTLLAAVPLVSSQEAWADDFRALNSSLWTLSSDVEHCSDGACFLARPDHASFGAGGLTLHLDQTPCNKTSCCDAKGKCASWASGHLVSVDTVLYGTFRARMRPAHVGSSGGPPKNAFSCWTPSYIGKPHNEIAVCFSGSSPSASNVHCSYWYDSTAHTKQVEMPAGWSWVDFHDYEVVWAPTFITFAVDGEVILRVDGTTSTIPYTAGHVLTILRPKDDVYLSDSAFDVASMSYDPSFGEAEAPGEAGAPDAVRSA